MVTPEVVVISNSSDGSSSTSVVPMPLNRTRVVLVGGGGAEELPRFCDRRPKQVLVSAPTTGEFIDGDDDAEFEEADIEVTFFLPPLKETDDRADLSTGAGWWPELRCRDGSVVLQPPVLKALSRIC
jgi:hypothetical protein